MMKSWHGAIHRFQPAFKVCILAFLLSLGFGYFSGFTFMGKTMRYSAEGIAQNYLGNENVPEAQQMQFRKSEREVLSIIHTHVLGLGMMFFMLALLLFTTSVPAWVRNFLAIEPFVSLVVTFGGVWLLWSGWSWMGPVIMVSGILLNIGFIATLLLLATQIIFVSGKDQKTD